MNTLNCYKHKYIIQAKVNHRVSFIIVTCATAFVAFLFHHFVHFKLSNSQQLTIAITVSFHFVFSFGISSTKESKLISFHSFYSFVKCILSYASSNYLHCNCDIFDKLSQRWRWAISVFVCVCALTTIEVIEVLCFELKQNGIVFVIQNYSVKKYISIGVYSNWANGNRRRTNEILI